MKYFGLLITALVTWAASSYVFHAEHKQQLQFYAETNLYKPKQGFDHLKTEVDLMPLAAQGFEVGISCLNAGSNLPRGCRMLSNMQSCAQIQCERDECSPGDESCTSLANEAWDAEHCQGIPQLCLGALPGLPKPPGETEPGIRCKFWDFGCRMVHSRVVVVWPWD